MPQNGRKNIFRDKQTTNKVPLTFLVGVGIAFPGSVNKQAIPVYVFSV